MNAEFDENDPYVLRVGVDTPHAFALQPKRDAELERLYCLACADVAISAVRAMTETPFEHLQHALERLNTALELAGELRPFDEVPS